MLPAAHYGLGNGCGKRQLNWCKDQVDLTCFLTKCLLVEIILGVFWHNLCLSGNLTHCQNSVCIWACYQMEPWEAFGLCLWSINESSYLAVSRATKMLIEVRDARKNVFHIACQLASTSFFLRLLSTGFFPSSFRYHKGWDFLCMPLEIILQSS